MPSRTINIMSSVLMELIILMVNYRKVQVIYAFMDVQQNDVSSFCENSGLRAVVIPACRISFSKATDVP